MTMTLTEEQVKNLINAKPTVTMLINLTSLEKLKVNLSDVKTDCMGLKYRTLDIDNSSFMVTEDQAEEIFEIMEPKLYEETFKEIEDKYQTEKFKREKLEEELEQLKEKYEGVLMNG